MTSPQWADFAVRFAAPKIYWLATVTPIGQPHTVPVWGVVLGNSIYLYSEPGTVKAQNLAHNDAVAVHLESGSDVVIVRGRAVDVPLGEEFAQVVNAFAAKYSAPSEIDYLPTSDGGTVVWRVEPHHAMSWELDDMDGSQRRWRAS